ncbi:hypothetical protein B0H16DRAFT_1482390 [Mycena metata]|uniref:Nephrocystin-3 n=1 Tax=Mycena metata TaxID=1033252 RepID=A0AAD7GTS8_9AGAR|nr:hypothetical protein B0H16DRAFT_1482390 [Mycena metata]
MLSGDGESGCGAGLIGSGCTGYEGGEYQREPHSPSHPRVVRVALRRKQASGGLLGVCGGGQLRIRTRGRSEHKLAHSVPSVGRRMHYPTSFWAHQPGIADAQLDVIAINELWVIASRRCTPSPEESRGINLIRNNGLVVSVLVLSHVDHISPDLRLPSPSYNNVAPIQGSTQIKIRLAGTCNPNRKDHHGGRGVCPISLHQRSRWQRADYFGDSCGLQTVKKNREDLEELCSSSTEIITILHDQIKAHGNTAAVKFKGLCEELESYLEAVILAIRNLQDQSKGLRGRVKEFLKSSSLTDEIAGYQTQIQGLMAIVETNFKVDEIHAIVTAPSFAVVKAVENINNCPPPSRIFQGRQAILDKMHQFFDTDWGNQHIYVLYGLGGAGKTQIALKFIEESSFSNVFLVDTSKFETIETGLKSIAVSKNVGDSAQDAMMWLQSNHTKWLVFFDNADDPKINLNDFLPKSSNGNIIITSRNPELRSYGAHTLVSDMEEADAITLLLRRANKESFEENLKLATEIVKELHYLPLAIVQAGAFISKSEDLEGYLALYHSNQAKLLSEKAAQSHDDYAQTVFTTWQISFNQLSHLAATLLQLCSFLHYTGISEDMFSTASKYDFLSWLPPREELQEPLEFLSHFLGPTGEWNSLKFLDVTTEIKAYSLISFDAKTKLFSIHPLVHAWSQTLPNETLLQSCMSSILGMCIAEIPENEMQQSSVRLLPHLVLLKSVNSDGTADFRRAFRKVYYEAGKFKDAQGIAEQILEKSQLLLGDEHPDTLTAMSNLAVTYFKLGEFRKAKELQVMVLENRTKVLGEDHPHTLLAMSNFALTCAKQGEFRKAEEVQVLVREEHRKLLGDEHLDTLSAMGNLAATYSDLGEFQKAKDLEEEVLEKYTKLLGENHPRTLLAMGNLAQTYSDLGEFRKMEEFEFLVLEKRTELLGEDHPDTLLTMNNLASTYSKLGELQKAKKLQVLVLEKHIKLLGEDYPGTLRAMANLAATYADLGELTKAEKLEVLVLEKCTKLLGEDHLDTLSAMSNLASTYSDLGEFQKAKEFEVLVLEKRTKLLGEDHPDTLSAMNNLASTYSDLGEFRKAEGLKVLVLEKHTKLLGEDHPNTLSAMGNLARTYSDLGEFQKAEELEVLVLEKQSKLLGEDHPGTLLAIGNLASTYSELGELRKAEKLKFLVLEKRTKLLGEDHPDTLSAMGNLAATYSTLGEFQKAKELEVLVLEKRAKLLGVDHPDTLRAMANLAVTYCSLDDFNKAQSLEVEVLQKRRQLFGDKHPHTILAMENLEATYQDLGQQEEMEELQELIENTRKSLILPFWELEHCKNLATALTLTGGTKDLSGLWTL